jgi:signal transduction histidine kinase
MAHGFGRYVLPTLLTVWAAAAVWGSEDWPAKVLVAGAVALVLTRPWPVIGLLAGIVGLYVGSALTPPSAEDAQLAMLVLACFQIGRDAPLRRQPWAGAVVLLLLSTNLLEPERDVQAADVVFPVLLTAGPWLLGLAVQLARRREQDAVRLAGDLADSRDEELRRATTEERLRIARELHDVVAHAISGLSLQAQLARRRAEAGKAVDVAQMRDIEQGAQQAMQDLRRLVGLLRPEDEEEPLQPESLDDLTTLVARELRLGQRVDIHTSGQPRQLPPALSAAAYRIVQETLTNARRHGSGGTTVELDWRDASLGIGVHNRVTDGSDIVAGHGLTGIGERARLFGGHADAGRHGDEWWVTVELPTPQPVAGPTA